MSTFDAMPAAGVIQADTLVLWGMRDETFNNEGQLAYTATKVTWLLIVTRFADNGHWIAQESPSEVARAVAAFIAQR